MAEPEYVPFELYRADLADFRADMARFREEVRGEMAAMRVDMARFREDLRGETAALRTDVYRLHAQTIIWLAGIVATGVALTVTLIKLIP